MSSVTPISKGSIMSQMASKFSVPENEMRQTLKETAFKGNVTDAQMNALLIVANEYNLNPWTKEIYAFPDRGGIVPIVGVDGWARIINENPAFDGMDFEQDAESCTCRIYRKDRAHPIAVTEYMSECRRDNAQPWKTHPKRMLRHKAMIQCARIAFGYTGIYDEDEAVRIVERDVTPEPQFNAEQFEAALLSIKESCTMEELAKAWAEIYKDFGANPTLTAAKDVRKKELSAPIDAEITEAGEDGAA